MLILFIINSIVLLIFGLTELPLPLLKTKNGILLGRHVTSYGNNSGYAFLGIPHAKPPVGELRFRAPVPAEPWNGIVDAQQYKLPCLADPTRTYKNKEGGPVSEDCLYINVFSSEQCLRKGGCAVMAVIHGGKMTFESPVIFKEESIINNFANEERNIVVVTIPYRLGTLGLFNLSPGLKTSQDTNVIVRDIIFALQWIQDDIVSFGGDKDKVTLFGHSVGATLANLVSISPMSEGIMNQLVVMSGFGATASDSSRGANSRFSQAIAVKLGCSKEGEPYNTTERVEAILKCIRSKSGEDVLAAQLSMSSEAESLDGTSIDGPGGVFPEYQFELMKTRRPLNTMIGTVTAEMRDGSIAADKNGRPIKSRIYEIADHFAYEMNYDKPEEFKKQYMKYYGRVNQTQFIIDDISFYVSTIKTANSLSDKSKVFVYSFSYTGIGNAYDKYNPAVNHPVHSEDFIYFFGLHRRNFTSKDYEIESIYTGLVANFVKYSDPSTKNQKWKPWKAVENNYFEIDFDDNLKMPGMKNGYYKEAEQFWTEVLPRYAGNWTPLEFFPPKMDVVNTDATPAFDIIFALQWIQDDIVSFGGDKDKVTLFGHSVGATLANLVSISPMSEGIMNQLVVMSGFGATASDSSRGANSRFSQAIAVKLGCSKEGEPYNTTERVEAILKCIRSKSGEDVLAAQLSMSSEAESLDGTSIDGPGGVFPEYQFELMKTRRPLNTMIGTVTAEMRDGSIAADKNGRPIKSRIYEIADHFAYEMNYDKPEEFKKQYMKYYGRVNQTQFIIDDISFYVSTIKTANSLSDKSKVFVYSFSYTGIGNAYDKYNPAVNHPVHSEDFIYFFGLHRRNFTSKDYEIESIYTGLVANFVKYSDPSTKNQKWKPWKAVENNYFEIDFDDNLKMPGMKNGYYKEAEQFWTEVLPRYAGNWTPLEFFPPKMDVVNTDATPAFAAHWTGHGITPDKNDIGLEKQYQQWAQHLPKLKAAKIIQTRELEIDEETIEEIKDTDFVYMAIGLVLILTVTVFSLLKCVTWKRNDYEPLI